MKRSEFLSISKTGKVDEKLYLDTGSTLLNLVLSGKASGGVPVGKIVNIVGDSSSGKSFLLLTSLACAVYDPKFKQYTKVYDDAEAADSFDKEYLFGTVAAKAIVEPPNSHSTLFEDFECNTLESFEKSCVYGLDSFDSLSDKDEEEHTKKRLEAHSKGKEVTGSYGMNKAKKASSFFRQLVRKIEKSKSILYIISQTRENINPMSFKKKTRAGGKALEFYSSAVVWMAEESKITRTVGGKVEQIGIISRLEVSKNKLTGRRGKVCIHIYYDYGVDDIGSCVEYMLSNPESGWKLVKQSVVVDAWNFKGTKEKLIQYIESQNKLQKLRAMVQKVWDDNSEKLKLKGRKRRF